MIVGELVVLIDGDLSRVCLNALEGILDDRVLNLCCVVSNIDPICVGVHRLCLCHVFVVVAACTCMHGP